MHTDRGKLATIVKNLIGNALKFTAAGEVVVACRIERGGAVLSVRDTGIGIAEEDLPMIFDMFRQVDSSDSRPYNGVGLGLYIVQSEKGRGSTFRVRLPVAYSVDPELPALRAASAG